jgi:hypothetical protein
MMIGHFKLKATGNQWIERLRKKSLQVLYPGFCGAKPKQGHLALRNGFKRAFQ